MFLNIRGVSVRPFRSNELFLLCFNLKSHAGDPDFERLIAKLKRTSVQFRQWWSKQDVLRSLAGHQHIMHGIAGRMTFEFTSFAVIDQTGLKLTVYTPLATDRTAEKLDAFLSGRLGSKGRRHFS